METNYSEFKNVFSNQQLSDDFYRFLQEIFHLYPEDKFHYLLAKTSKELSSDRAIYQEVQQKLSTIKPFLSELTFALPALKKQKREMTRQILELLGNQQTINGYLEIGSTGRYVSHLKQKINVNNPIYLTNDIAPSNSIGDLFERGQFAKLGTFIPLNNYDVITPSIIANESVEVVTCLIGLHHCPTEKLTEYVNSIKRILKKGGKFILRDHDVTSTEMNDFVSLVHTVFNLGLASTWEQNEQEFRSFKPIEEWSSLITSFGFKDEGIRLFQQNDPSDNALLVFTKL
jgi:SAM-dependent methyltransferase